VGCLPKDNIRIVINRHLKDSDISLSDAEKAVKQEIFWSIPNDYKTTMSAINQGKTISEINVRSHIASNLRDMAYSLAHEEEEQKEKKEKRLWDFLKRT
jgi:pilus assembly protein CpaE